jgi:hypothetical protein
MVKCFLILAFFGAALTSLGGCAQREARLEYQTSTENYKACVVAKGPPACETERVLMETDERKYTNIGAGMEGQAVGVNVNVQKR